MLKNSKLLSVTYLAIFSLAIITTLGLVACSGGGENNSKTTGNENTGSMKENTETAQSGPHTIEIEGLDSLQFSKTEINAKPGEQITVKLVNNTSMPAESMSHDFVLLKKDTDPATFVNDVLKEDQNGSVPSDLTDKVIAHTGMVAGGESDSVTFTVPEETGEYTYVCTFPGHFASGMKGKLIVK